MRRPREQRDPPFLFSLRQARYAVFLSFGLLASPFLDDVLVVIEDGPTGH